MDILEELNARLNVYLSVLKSAEEEGNAGKVRRYKRIIKQYTDAISQHKNGKQVVFEELPNPPGFSSIGGGSQLTLPGSAQLTPNPSPTAVRRSPSPLPNRSPMPPRKLSAGNVDLMDLESASPLPVRKSETAEDISDSNAVDIGGQELIQLQNNQDVLPVIVTSEASNDECVMTDDPEILLSALNSRLETYKSVKDSAEQEGNNSKVRRYQRIIKQYTDSIKLLQNGKPVPLEELPNPPGFPPLVPPKSATPSPVPERREITPQPSPTPPEEPPRGSGGDNVVPETAVKFVTSRAEKQTIELKERQQEYKQAAINAKKLGQLEEAKEYLKIFKGFDRLIQASECGLPVDMTTIPVSPNSKQTVDDGFHMVTAADYTEGDAEVDLFTKLEIELTEQIKRCLNIRNNFKSNGDVANANRFEQFAVSFKKDLNSVKAAHQRGDPLPKFHYENKSFGIIQCCNDLQSNELELTIVQGVNYKVSNPDEVDTYIKYEFPYPSENPPKGRTEVVKNTNNPQYNVKVNFTIHRELKACQRIFKRHGIKLEVMSKTGLFHSDILLGTVVVKLMPLNTQLMIHDAFDLMNGRRTTGGKLEIKVRIREPLLSKKLEQVTEKWIILD